LDKDCRHFIVGDSDTVSGIGGTGTRRVRSRSGKRARGTWSGGRRRGINIEADLDKIDGDLHQTRGNTRRRSWRSRGAVVRVGQNDNVRCSSWTVVGTQGEYLNGVQVLRFQVEFGTVVFRAIVPQSLHLLRDVGVEHSEGHLVFLILHFRDQFDSLFSSRPFILMRRWFQVCLGLTAHSRFLVPAGPFRPHPLFLFRLLPACI
jgi:hypothetical protein